MSDTEDQASPEPNEQVDGQQTADGDVRIRKLRRGITILFAVIMGATLGIVGVIWYQTSLVPPLDQQRFDEAEALWKKEAPATYDIMVEVTGRQAARYEVRVENGKVVKALRDGKPLTQERTWATWSVRGMFSTIATDLNRKRDLKDLSLRAQFHRTFGYPQRYQRVQAVRQGENTMVTWKVIRFRPQ